MTNACWLASAFVHGVVLLAAVAQGATPAAICSVAKLKAASHKATSKLKCYAAAVKTSTPVDPGCLAKADGKFQDAFAKAEAKGGCGTTGDVGRVEGHIDGCVAKLAGDEPAGCAKSQQPCSTTTPCCPGEALTCPNGTGVCCGLAGHACAAGTECCSGFCDAAVGQCM